MMLARIEYLQTQPQTPEVTKELAFLVAARDGLPMPIGVNYYSADGDTVGLAISFEDDIYTPPLYDGNYPPKLPEAIDANGRVMHCWIPYSISALMEGRLHSKWLIGQITYFYVNGIFGDTLRRIRYANLILNTGHMMLQTIDSLEWRKAVYRAETEADYSGLKQLMERDNPHIPDDAYELALKAIQKGLWVIDYNPFDHKVERSAYFA